MNYGMLNNAIRALRKDAVKYELLEPSYLRRMADYLESALRSGSTSVGSSQESVKNAVVTLRNDASNYDYLQPEYLKKMADYLEGSAR